MTITCTLAALVASVLGGAFFDAAGLAIRSGVPRETTSFSLKFTSVFVYDSDLHVDVVCSGSVCDIAAHSQNGCGGDEYCRAFQITGLDCELLLTELRALHGQSATSPVAMDRFLVCLSRREAGVYEHDVVVESRPTAYPFYLDALSDCPVLTHVLAAVDVGKCHWSHWFIYPAGSHSCVINMGYQEGAWSETMPQDIFKD